MKRPDHRLIYGDIEDETDRQVEKWGVQTHPPIMWIAIITEEIGEAAQAVLQGDIDNYRTELVQIAACCVSALHALDLNEDNEET